MRPTHESLDDTARAAVGGGSEGQDNDERDERPQDEVALKTTGTVPWHVCCLGKRRSYGENYEEAADCRYFTTLRRVIACAGSTAKRGEVEGGCTKSGQHHQWR